MIHSYNTLITPLAQIAAAEEFCASVEAYFADTYEGDASADPMDPQSVLDVLACLGLRFETDGQSYEEDGDSFFVWQKDRVPPELCGCLYAYAQLVADEFEENGFVLYGNDGFERPTMLEVVTLHGCVLDNLIFVPDPDGVASAAYSMLRSPQNALRRILFDGDDLTLTGAKPEDSE